MKANPNGKPKKPLLKIVPRWVLILLVLFVLVFAGLALTSPIAQRGFFFTPTLVAEEDLNGDSPAIIGTPGQQETNEVEEVPPVPEEIGYTDGIIIWSTVLILILLVGTLRETIVRKSR